MSNTVESETPAYTFDECLEVFPSYSELHGDKLESCLAFISRNINVSFFDEETGYAGLTEESMKSMNNLNVNYLIAYFDQKHTQMLSETARNQRDQIPEQDRRKLLEWGTIKEILTTTAQKLALQTNGKPYTYADLQKLINEPTSSNNESNPILSVNERFGSNLAAYDEYINGMQQFLEKLSTKSTTQAEPGIMI